MSYACSRTGNKTVSPKTNKQTFYLFIYLINSEDSITSNYLGCHGKIQ